RQNLATLTLYTSQLDAGSSRAQIVDQVESTLKYRQLLVTRLYRLYLNRGPSSTELASGASTLATGGTVEDLVGGLGISNEFSLMHGNIDLTKQLPTAAANRSFVSTLLMKALGSAPSSMVEHFRAMLSDDTTQPSGQVVIDAVEERRRVATAILNLTAYRQA